MRAIFSKIEAKNAGIAIATTSSFNEDIWKKSRISLSFLSRQSTNYMNPYSLKPLPSDIQALLADKFRVLRKAQGYSQEEMAKRSGVSLGSLKRFENTGQISLESLLKLSHLLDRLDDFKTVFVQGEDMKQIEKLFKS